jgi:multiple RNA-binding domain-containing protein 1
MFLNSSIFRDGKFRRFAFVGFSNEKDAFDCQNYFNQTYMDTSKLQVDLALPVGDSSLPRPWSRHSRGSSAYSAFNPEESEASRKKDEAEAQQQRLKLENEKKRKFLFSIYGAEEAMDDPAQAAELEKFMNAMKTKSQTKTWENDTDVFSKTANSQLKARVNVNVKSVKSKKAGGEGILIPKVHMKFDAEEEEDTSGYFEKSEDEDLYEDFPIKNHEDKEANESNDVIASSLVDIGAEKNTSTVSDPNTTNLNTANIATNKYGSKYEKLSPEMIAESGRLFVRNLSYAVTEEDLEKLFSQYGPLSQVHLPIAKDTKRPIGMAYILFMLPDDALKAFSALDGTIFQGRLLHILPAKDQPTREETGSNSENSNNYKANKEKELKGQSSSSHNWNSLFIRSDAVLDAVAARLGVPKSSIMNTHESDSLATRLAIAETHIIQETKEYLESEGVYLDAFINNSNVERSKTVILVKNLPFEVELEELRSLFGKYGGLGRVILPPLTRSIAMIEFLECNEAKSAFRALAYSKFHSAPLFLEWAPINSLKERITSGLTAPVKIIIENPKESGASAGAVVEESSGSSNTKNTLYIKNLSFKTEVSTLKKLFSSMGPIRSVRIPTKPSPSNASVQLSLGFGFIEFAESEDVNRALDTMQGVQLDGHALILKKASGGVSESSGPTPNSSKKRKVSNEEIVDESLKPCKLLIRNIPFESTEAELRTLIKSFTASLKRLRIPKKFDGSHRGFGFAEFTSHSEAKHLKETLAATHLYGRHLVIEWAKLDQDQESNN